MNPHKSSTRDASEEIPALIETLLATEQRLEELTGGEVDTVAGRDGRTFLLRRAQEQLRFREAARQGACLNELRALFDLVPAMIWLKDTKDRILRVNQRAADMAGKSIGEIEGKPASENYPQEAAQHYADELDVIHSGRPKMGMVEKLSDPKGQELWVQTDKVPVLDKDGKVTGLVVMVQDISELKRVEEALRSSELELSDRARQLERVVGQRTAELTATNQQLEAFVYSIAHDLRAPLRSMQGFATLLLTEAGTALGERGRDLANRIEKSARFMDSMLQGLLAFSRVAQQNIELTPVNLEIILQSTLSSLDEVIKQTKARLEIAGPWPIVLAHARMAGQILTNLVDNALKFVGPDVSPHIRIRTENQGLFLRVWVEDNGIGIAPEHQGQIFGLFKRLHGDEFAGTGIGLAIVQKSVERMGGTAGMESASVQGSRFWFQLRKAPAANGTGQVGAAGPTEGHA